MNTAYDAKTRQNPLNQMVKLGARQPTSSAADLRTASLICYICGAGNANWPVYSKPTKVSAKNPFFPFLEYHVPALGCRPLDGENGAVDACTVCFSFLTQQWRAFEQKSTPIVKRLYWLKRSGNEGEPERATDIQESLNVEGNTSNDVDSFREITPQMHDINNCDTHSKVQIKTDLIRTEDFEPARVTPEQGSDAPSIENASPVFEIHESSSPKMSIGGKRAIVEMCYVCSRQKPKEFMRSVHTRAQLKTETPFYPCLSKHNPPLAAKRMDFLGKVLVCEACQKFLFRQWQVFQKNNTPLSERQYQLRSDPSLPRDQQSQLSTMVCFICGVTQPATSGRFLYSRKHTQGDPYYSFLNSLIPPPGAMPLTKQGLTRACSGCRKSLHRQWKQFESEGLPEEQREYRIRNDASTISISTSSPVSPMSTVPINKPEVQLVCYTCAEPCEESGMRPIYTKMDVNPLKGSFCFPFIALLQSPDGCRPIDSMGRTLVCKRCFRFLQSKWEQFESEKVPHQMRIYAVGGRENLKLKPKCHNCFLCGFKYERQSPWKLHSYPQSSEGVKDGGPFFPLLVQRKPNQSAKAIDSEGSVIVCEICYTNLMEQWNSYEKSVIPSESNRWLRKYRAINIICYLCGVQKPREYCAPVSRSLVTLPSNCKVPKGSLIVSQGHDVVLCASCWETVREESKYMGGEGGASVSQDNTDGSCQQQIVSSPPIQQSRPRRDRSIIVIDSSDSEADDARLVRQEETYLNSVTGHATVTSMHYTASASPIAPPSSSSPQSRERPVSVSPSANMQSSSNRSFAAALRKLAKQAMPPGAASSPTSSSASGSKPGSPTVSSARSKGTISPSRSSPAASHTPPVSRAEPALNTERLAHGTDKDLQSIRTPPMPPIPTLESDHRNQTGDDNHAPNQGPHRPKPNPSPHRAAHEVIPGVFASRPGYHPEPAAMLSEHYPSDHGPHAVPYYLQAGKPDMPLFVPRVGPIPGPPPLLASKHDRPDTHVVSPYYPAPFPPNMIDSPDMHFETWRQRRALEHLRQQHERQDVHPMPLPNSDLASPKDPTTDKDKRDSEVPPGESHVPMVHRMYYYNDNNNPPNCPVHGHGTTPEGHHPHQHPQRPEPLPTAKSDRPEEFNRMFLPPHPDGAAMLHPFLVHPPRDGPFAAHHLGERQAEMMRERQELLLHQRLMLDPREHMKAREEEWQRHQHQLRQDKEDYQREMAQYRHMLLQPQDREQPRHRMEQPHHHMEHPRHLEQPRHLDQRRLDTASKSPSGKEHPTAEQAHKKEMFHPYPFHPAFHPRQPGQHHPDHHRKDGHPLDKDVRTPHTHPVSFHGSHYRPDFPFRHEGIVTSASERMYTDSEWPRHGRAVFVNGDLRVADVETRRNMSPGMSQRIKVEKVEETQASHPVKVKHDHNKLKFLEGLGLVTLDRKKELTHGDASVKRKYTGSPVVLEQPAEKRNGESAGVRREEVEETSSEGTSEADSGTGASTDTDVSTQQYAEKVEFFARLGLVPPHKRQEMEQSYEVKRSERKKRRRKGRGRPTKRQRREDEENSENGRSPVDFEGPLTRQKQQQLKELQAQAKNNSDESIGEKPAVVRIKTEKTDEPEPPYMFDKQEKPYRRSSAGNYDSPTSEPDNRPPPRLTLSSLTNMEDPFANYEASTFRPPYLRHTGLLSVSQETMQPDGRLHPHGRLQPDNQSHPDGRSHPDARLQPDGRSHPDARLHPDARSHPDGRLQLDGRSHPDARLHPDARSHPDGRLQPDRRLHPDARIHADGRSHPDVREHPDARIHPDARLQPDGRLSAPLRPEPVRSTGISLSERETRDYLARRSSPGGPSADFSRHFGSLGGQQGSSFEKPTPGHQPPPGEKDAPAARREESYRWPGVENVMKAYFLHTGDRQMEMSFLQENANILRSNHVSLNEEANALSTQMTNLVQTKRELVEEKKAYREDLDRLHYFMQSFQR